MEVTLGTWRLSVERTLPTPVELVAAYDEAASRWHGRLGQLGYERAYDTLFLRIMAESTLGALEGGGRVLDAGVGTGAFGLALARSMACPLRIDGVDISAAMLGQARCNLEREDVEFHPHLCDARNLPFEDAAFDAVIGSHVLEHLDHPLAGLSEMVRVLKPGGTFVLATTRRGRSDALLRLRWRYETIEQGWLVREMEEAGFSSIASYPLAGGGPVPRWTSCAYAGLKKASSSIGKKASPGIGGEMNNAA